MLKTVQPAAVMVSLTWFSFLFCLVTAQYDQQWFTFEDGTEFTLTASGAPLVLPDCPCTSEPGCCGLGRNIAHTVAEHSSIDQDLDGGWLTTRCLIYNKHEPTLTLCTSCPGTTFLYYDDCTLESFHVKATCYNASGNPTVTAYFGSKIIDIPKMGVTMHLKFCKKSEYTTQRIDSTTRETLTTPVDRGHTRNSPPNHVTSTTTQMAIPTSDGDIPIHVPLIIGLVLGVVVIMAVTAVIIAVIRQRKRRREENSAAHIVSDASEPSCGMGVNVKNSDSFERTADVDPPPDYFSAVQSSKAQHKGSNTGTN